MRYVRVVRLRPLAPEQTELTVEYLFSAESLADPALDIAPAVEFTNRVMTEDAGVCELNQSGLKASVHARGVVMPEEYVIKQFHDWVSARTSMRTCWPCRPTPIPATGSPFPTCMP